jgi:hypothetical protein
MVSSGQLEPLAQIEIRKQVGGKLLESGWKLVGGHRGPELWVEPRPAIGWTAETCGEACAEAADGADPIVPPWDPSRGGIAYRFTGAAIYRRDLALTRHAPERALVVATRAELLAIAGRAAAGQACHAARAQGTVDW